MSTTVDSRARPRPPTGRDLERFYAEAMPVVFRYFLSRCGGDRAVAEDLTQDTMLSAACEIRHDRFGRYPIPWVLGIARHRLLDHYGRKARDRRRAIAWHDATRTRAQFEEATDLAADQVHEALAGLPGMQRAVVVLHHLDGLAVDEVAELIHRSPAATESLLARGRASLRAALEGGDRP